MSYDEYKELDPADLQKILVKHGARILVQDAQGALIYGLPWGSVCILPKSATEYAQHTAHLVAKILEWFGPSAVYALWHRVEERRQEAVRRRNHIDDLCRASGWGDDR